MNSPCPASPCFNTVMGAGVMGFCQHGIPMLLIIGT